MVVDCGRVLFGSDFLSLRSIQVTVQHSELSTYWLIVVSVVVLPICFFWLLLGFV
jgi:hypothetical protein